MRKGEDLLNYESVRTWITSIAASGTGSERTGETYLRLLSYFLDFAKLDPDDLVKLAKEEPGKVKALLNDLIVTFERRGRSRKYTANIFNTVMSFLRENDARISIRSPKVFVKSRRRMVAAEEIRHFINFARPRLRAYMACMKDSGLAPIDLLKLKYGDVRRDLEAGKVPIKISMVRSKTRAEFDTFLGPDAVEYLKHYLEIRRAGTDKIPPEELKDNSPLFADERRRITSPLTLRALRRDFLHARKPAGTAWSLYSLRAFFITNLKAAGVSSDLVEFWSGHKLPDQVDAYFFSPENQEKIYMGAYPRIVLKPEVDEEKRRKAQVLDTLKLLGTSEDKIAKIREMIEARTFGDDLLEEIGETLRAGATGTRGPAKKRKAARRSRPRKQRPNRYPLDPPIGCG